MWNAYVVTSADRILDGSFEKFLESVLRQSAQVRVIVGLRGCDLPLETVRKVHATVRLPFNTSLSKARNELLAAYPSANNEWVCFPDDDCWYPEGLLNEIDSAKNSLDFLIGVIDTGQKVFPNNEDPRNGIEVDLQLALRVTASAALFVSGEKIQHFRFDERLGLGAKVGSAEDLDLVLFLLQQGNKGIYTQDLRVGHPYKPQRDGQYFEGSIAALSKFYGCIPMARYSALRRTIRGIILATLGKLPLKQALRGFFYLIKKW